MSLVTHGQASTGWTVDDSTFGVRLALIRVRMDWNLKEAARACGLPAASWRTWERDGVMPRRIVEVAKLISGATGCDYLWLLTGSPSGVPSTNRYGTPTTKPQVKTPLMRPPNRLGDTTRPPSRPAAAGRPALLRGTTSG